MVGKAGFQVVSVGDGKKERSLGGDCMQGDGGTKDQWSSSSSSIADQNRKAWIVHVRIKFISLPPASKLPPVFHLQISSSPPSKSPPSPATLHSRNLPLPQRLTLPPPPLPLNPKPLLRLQRPIHIQPHRPRTGHHRHGRKPTHGEPNDLQRIGIALHQQALRVRALAREILDDLHQRGGVATVLLRVGGQGGVRSQAGLDLVLEDGAAEGDAEGLAEGAEEGEHGDGEGEVFVRGRGLDGEGHACEEHAGAEARDEVEEDAGWGRGGDVEEVEEGGAEGGEEPAGPDGPAVAARFADEDAHDDGCGGDGEGLGEEGDAGEDGGFAFDGFVVEREVVEKAPEDHAVDGGAEVADCRGAVFEDGERDEGLGGEEFFVDDEGSEAGQADQEWDERAPGGPGVCDAAPGDGD